MSIKRVDYGALVQNAAKKYGIQPELIEKVIQVESGGNPSAASGTGPVGLMQVSEALSKDYGYSLNDRLDPAKNIDMGARYLAQNLKAFNGNMSKALLGYNQGTNGAKQMLNGSRPMTAEGAKYINNPAFRQFTTNDIANPVANLPEPGSANTFNPALLQRGVAEQAPSQAEAMSSDAVPAALIQQDPSTIANNGEDTSQGGNWSEAALAALSMLASKQPRSQTVQGWTGLGRGASQWSPETQRVMQLLNKVTSAPRMGGGS